MSEKYSSSVCVVRVICPLDHAAQVCRKHAAIESRRLVSVTDDVQIFERVKDRQSREECLIVGDIRRDLPRMERTDQFGARDEHCQIERALFDRIGSDFGSPHAGRKVTGLLAVESKCSDAKREAEWHDWYNTVHVPDMLASGLYHTAYRFEIVSRTEGRGHYLALYETDLDPATAHRSFWDDFRPKWISSGRVIDTMHVTSAASYSANALEYGEF